MGILKFSSREKSLYHNRKNSTATQTKKEYGGI